MHLLNNCHWLDCGAFCRVSGRYLTNDNNISRGQGQMLKLLSNFQWINFKLNLDTVLSACLKVEIPDTGPGKVGEAETSM